VVDGGWRKSRASGQSACLEVARATDGDGGDEVLLRDSKHPDGARIRLTPTEWRAFVAGVRAGEFDDICP
jgi:hypothetical protein